MAAKRARATKAKAASTQEAPAEAPYAITEDESRQIHAEGFRQAVPCLYDYRPTENGQRHTLRGIVLARNEPSAGEERPLYVIALTRPCTLWNAESPFLAQIGDRARVAERYPTRILSQMLPARNPDGAIRSVWEVILEPTDPASDPLLSIKVLQRDVDEQGHVVGTSVFVDRGEGKELP